MKNKSLKIVVAILILVLFSGASFYGGMIYGKGRGTNQQFSDGQNGGFARGNGTRNTNGGPNSRGGNFISGEIISKDDKSITIKTPNNGSKIIMLSSTTTISKSTDGALNDLENGKTVMISGTTNTDGSIAAQNIQIRPAGTPIPGGQAAQPAKTK